MCRCVFAVATKLSECITPNGMGGENKMKSEKAEKNNGALLAGLLVAASTALLSLLFLEIWKTKGNHIPQKQWRFKTAGR